MVFFLVLCIIFLSMIMFPIGLAMISKQHKTKPLFIQQSNTKDPRYFAASFKKIFDKAWENYDGSGVLRMSREEKVIEIDKVKLEPFKACNAIVYSEKKDFFPSEGIVFEKEIYIKGNARLEKIPMVRAIVCEKSLVLKPGTKVIRWADAEGILTAYNDCDLGISTSSGTQLIIGENCFFKRLYAPIILLGKKAQELDGGIEGIIRPDLDVTIFPNIIRDIKYVDDEIVNEEGILKGTIITKYDITVLGNFIVQGHIRSHKDVKIDDNVVVHGNIFAEGNVFIGMNVKILGLIFSQENIYVDDGAIVGQPGKVKSMVARGDILFGRNCRVYGYIGTEGKGSICPSYNC